MEMNGIDSISDDDVVASFINSVGPNGILRCYLEQGQVNI